MSDFDTNYNSIFCPYCEKRISDNDNECGTWVDNLSDEEYDFYQCQRCDKFFKAELNIFKEYEYNISKPTKEEVKKYNLIVNKNKDFVEDCPGQKFMWDNLLSNES